MDKWASEQKGSGVVDGVIVQEEKHSLHKYVITNDGGGSTSDFQASRGSFANFTW